MRGDLRDCLISLDWADAQIPILQDRFVAWQRSRPYRVVVEPDPNSSSKELLCAYPETPLNPLIIGDIGAIINSARAALDLMMYAVLAAHGVKSKSSTHFPIRKHAKDFLDAINAIEAEKRLNPAEVAAIKRTEAYLGGDHFLYPFHQLDITRKHERLIVIEPAIERGTITAIGGSIEPVMTRMKDKTILYRLPAGQFRPTPGNANVIPQISFNEPTISVADKPVIAGLRAYINRVRALIIDFP